MPDPPLGVEAILKMVLPYLAAGYTEKELEPFRPMVQGWIKDLPPEGKVALAIALKEKAPQLADMIDRWFGETQAQLPPPQPQAQPQPQDQEPEDLTEDEEAQIARYAEGRYAEGKSYRAICEEVNATYDSDLGVRELHDIVSRYRAIRYHQEKRAQVKTYHDQVLDLQEALAREKAARQSEVQAEKKAHLATVESEGRRLLDYRDGLVLRWGASLLAAGAVGLVLGRLLR